VFAFFVTIHVMICVALILVVLLQAGKGGGLAGAFGAGTAQTLFGGRGAATFLAKTTSWLAVAFMAMSILLAVLSSRGQSSGDGILQRRARERASQAQLPPSTSTFNPGAVDSTAPPLPQSPAPAPAAGTPPAAPAPAGPTK